MRTLLRLPIVAVSFFSLAALSIGAGAATLEEQPGFAELGEFAAPQSGGQFVEVNVQGALLALAARIVAREEPAVADLIRGLQSVRVNVVSLDDNNRQELQERAATIGTTLQSKGWSRVARVRESGDAVDVFVKTGADDAIEGVTITVMQSSGEAVFVNVVGNIQPDQIAMLGERLGLEPLRNIGPIEGS